MSDEARGNSVPVRMQIYTTAIPMRGFEHAAARRELAEAVVVRVDFAGGAVGWGETLPRPYVTGETFESVVEDLQTVFWPALAGRSSGPEDVGRIVSAASRMGGPSPRRRLLNAAACAMDLALSVNRDSHLFPEAGARTGAAGTGSVFAVQKTVPVPGLDGDGGGDTGKGDRHRFSEDAKNAEEGDRHRFLNSENGARPRFPAFEARVSGVLGSSDPARTARRLRLMRWFGLRDFKLKLGFSPEVDAENLRVVSRKLGGALRSGKCTLRVDVNSAWAAGSVPDHVGRLVEYGVCVVEQPADLTAVEMVELARKCPLPLMADETLLVPADAAVLLTEPRIWWNIRLSKNGGLLPALEMCRQAAERGVNFVCGCLVGESGILSSAQRRLLQLAPRPRFIEGNYGRFLLSDDLTRPSLRFGYGGRLRPLPAGGLGVEVDELKLLRYGKLAKTLTA
jgi:L-Ala-D/L-Glu epimerase